MTDKAESTRSDNMEGRVQLYEVGLLLLPTIPQDEIAGSVEEVKKALEKHGTLSAVRVPELRQLAYPMGAVVNEKKVEFGKAYLVSMIIEAETRNIENVRVLLKKDARVIRSLIITRTAEDIALEEEYIKARAATAKAEGEKGDMSDADMDKMIDELVVQ